MTDHIYDVETYPNCFTIAIGNVDTRTCKVFEISFRKDQREALFKELREIYKAKGRMVGFNNVFFDYPVLHYLLLNKKATVRDIYDKAMAIIKSEERWEHTIKDDDMFIPQIDLFKIHHFDNKAKATSLKILEFNMRSENIEDLPFPVGTFLTSEQIDDLIKYNRHDMAQTFKFYQESKKQIEFREELTRKYNRNFINHNDTKIGKDYFVMRLEEEHPKCCYKGGRIQQTKRAYIDLSECVFDYVKFERPEFKAVLQWFREQVITETKGVFSDITEDRLGDVAKYAVMVTKKKKLDRKPTDEEIEEMKKELPLCWVEEVTLKSKKVSYNKMWRVAETLNVVVDGFRYDFGVGGIHGSVESTVVESSDDTVIRDEDVTSYYPNLAIKNKIKPEHLPKSFCDVYEDMFNQRKVFDKKSAENAMLKLALNGTYGASNDKYSPFYDPKFTMMITINGQLSLCMMIEQLIKIDGLKIIQCNTDGVTFTYNKADTEKVEAVRKWWMEVTKLELETAMYRKMVIRDVNNYLAIKTNGELKNKGAYEWKDLPHHKNQSSLIIQMAAEEFLVNGTDIGEYIRNHNDKFDFMIRTKVPRSSSLVGIDDFGVEHKFQNICRYYISLGGVELVKIMPPKDETEIVDTYVDTEGNEIYATTKAILIKCIKKGYTYLGKKEITNSDRRIGINTGWKVTVCNDIKDYKGNINYDYYIQETEKLVNFTFESEDSQSTEE